MVQTDKPAWPRTPDGTTNWEVVFESPDTGLIPLIAKAQSVEALHLSTTVVIEKLFTRRGDEDAVRILKHQLETLLNTEGDFTSKQTGVTQLLRDIKETRIEKARIYLERKRAGAAIDRRAGLMWKIDFLLRPRVLIPVGLIFVMLLSGIVFALLQSTIGGPAVPVAMAPSDQTAPEEPGTGSPAADKPKPVDPTIQAPDTPPPPPEPIKIWLKTLRWPLSSLSANERPQYFSVILYVDTWDDKVQVCRYTVKVMDKLYLAFNHVLPQDRRASNIELEELGGLIPSALNLIFEQKLVKKAEIFRYGQEGYKAATLPPYCQSPDKPD